MNIDMMNTVRPFCHLILLVLTLAPQAFSQETPPDNTPPDNKEQQRELALLLRSGSYERAQELLTAQPDLVRYGLHPMDWAWGRPLVRPDAHRQHILWALPSVRNRSRLSAVLRAHPAPVNALIRRVAEIEGVMFMPQDQRVEVHRQDELAGTLTVSQLGELLALPELEVGTARALMGISRLHTYSAHRDYLLLGSAAQRAIQSWVLQHLSLFLTGAGSEKLPLILSAGGGRLNRYQVAQILDQIQRMDCFNQRLRTSSTAAHALRGEDLPLARLQHQRFHALLNFSAGTDWRKRPLFMQPDPHSLNLVVRDHQQKLQLVQQCVELVGRVNELLEMVKQLKKD